MSRLHHAELAREVAEIRGQKAEFGRPAVVPAAGPRRRLAAACGRGNSFLCEADRERGSPHPLTSTSCGCDTLPAPRWFDGDEGRSLLVDATVEQDPDDHMEQ